MFLLGTSWITLSRYVRRWLTLRVYRNKITYRDKIPYLVEPLTVGNKAIIFTLHLFILGGLAATIIFAFLGLIKLIHG